MPIAGGGPRPQPSNQEGRSCALIRARPRDVTLQRVRSDLLEMPGLRLTCQQGQRLWGLDAATCRAVLESLVEAKFLRRTGRAMYTRLTEGRTGGRLPQMTTAGPDRIPRRLEEAM
jgi:hypothetical protein